MSTEWNPYNQDAERLVIGATLRWPSIMAHLPRLSVTDFSAKYGQYWEAIQDIYQRDGTVDLVTVCDWIERRYPSDDGAYSETFKALAPLDVLVTSEVFAIRDAQVIVDKSRRRQLIRLAQTVMERAISDDVDAIASTTMQQFASLMNSHASKRLTMRLSDAIDQYYDTLEAANKQPDWLLKTGYSDLDATIGGIKPGWLLYVVARPKMGKSAFALLMAERIARTFQQRKSGRLLYLTMEMPLDDLIERMLSKRFSPGIPSSLIRAGFRLADGNSNIEAYTAAITHLASIREEMGDHFEISNHAGATLADIEMMLVMHPDIKVLVVDQVNNISHHGKDEYSRLSDVSKALKQLAMRRNVVIIALHQVSREAERRPDHRPQLSDLHGSGHFEMDADYVLGLYRHGYYYPPNPDSTIAEHPALQNYAECNILAARGGSTDTMIPLYWQGKTQEYVDWPYQVYAMRDIEHCVKMKEGMR